MAKFTSLDIADNAKHAIANGIFNAVTNDIPELIQDNNLPTAVGSGLFRWNFINRNVSDNLGGTFQTSYAKRGAWKVLLLYERNTEFTFSIMTEKNLSKLKKHLPEGIHYLEALLSKNTGYDVIEGQIKLDTFEKSRDSSLVDRLREQLLNDFAGIIKNHILILFDYEFNRVLSARAVLLTPNLEVAFSENWSQYLNKPYINKASILAEMIDDDDDLLVSMKEPEDNPDPDDTVTLPQEQDISND